MQYTNKTEYNDVVADFLTSGWTLVYRADTTISQPMDNVSFLEAVLL
jgi:hypothetical protein